MVRAWHARREVLEGSVAEVVDEGPCGRRRARAALRVDPLDPHLVADEQLARVGARKALAEEAVRPLGLVAVDLLGVVAHRAPLLADARLDLVRREPRRALLDVMVHAALVQGEGAQRAARLVRLRPPAAVVAHQLGDAVEEQAGGGVGPRLGRPRPECGLPPAHLHEQDVPELRHDDVSLLLHGEGSALVAQDVGIHLVGELERDERRAARLRRDISAAKRLLGLRRRLRRVGRSRSGHCRDRARRGRGLPRRVELPLRAVAIAGG